MKLKVVKVEDGKLAPPVLIEGAKTIIGYIGDEPSFIIANHAGAGVIVTKDEPEFQHFLAISLGAGQ